MPLIKNVATHSMDVGGRILAAGEVAYLDAKGPVKDGLATGVLVEAITEPERGRQSHTTGESEQPTRHSRES